MSLRLVVSLVMASGIADGAFAQGPQPPGTLQKTLARLGRVPKAMSQQETGVQLDLSHAAVRDDDLEAIASLKELQWLTLSHTPITDAGLGHLAAAKELKGLTLTGTRVTVAGLAGLSALPKLRTLRLEHLPVGNAAIAPLAALSLTELDLSYTRLTAGALAALEPAATLWNLRLEGTKIDASDLHQLKRLPGLRFLSLRGTGLPEEEVREFQRARPDVQVSFHFETAYNRQQALSSLVVWVPVLVVGGALAAWLLRSAWRHDLPDGARSQAFQVGVLIALFLAFVLVHVVLGLCGIQFTFQDLGRMLPDWWPR